MEEAGLLLTGMACAQLGLGELRRFGAVEGKCFHPSLLSVSALQYLSDTPPPPPQVTPWEYHGGVD